MTLLGVNSRNHDLLSITRLVTLFDSFDSEAEAVRSLSETALPLTTPMRAAVVSGA